MKAEQNKKGKRAMEETSKITQAWVRQLYNTEKLQYLTLPELSTKAAHNAQAQLADPLAKASILVQNTRFSLPPVSRAPVVGSSVSEYSGELSHVEDTFGGVVGCATSLPQSMSPQGEGAASEFFDWLRPVILHTSLWFLLLSILETFRIIKMTLHHLCSGCNALPHAAASSYNSTYTEKDLY